MTQITQIKLATKDTEDTEDNCPLRNLCHLRL